MNLAGVSWYLSGLLLLMALATSAATVVPGHEAWFRNLIIGLLSGAVLFAVLAVIFRLRFRHHRYYRAGLPLKLYVGFAGVLTLLLVLGILG